MGWISDRHMRSGGSLNRNPANNGSNNGPLRKIVGRQNKDGCWFEKLECGHLQLPQERHYRRDTTSAAKVPEVQERRPDIHNKGSTMKLLEIIEDYDTDMRFRIAMLESEVAKLKQENRELMDKWLGQTREQTGLLLKAALAGVLCQPAKESSHAD